MNTADFLIQLINASLFKKKVRRDTVCEDFDALYKLAVQHKIVNIVKQGVKKAGVVFSQENQKQLETAAKKEAYQYLLQQQALTELSAAFEKAGVAHVVLKGARMRLLYPSAALRTSCDIDILVKTEDRAKAQMLAMGYSLSSSDKTTCSLKKSQLLVVELHKSLFDDEIAFESFVEIWERVIPVARRKNTYLLTETDFYVYMIAHMAKHFMRYGCGIRPVLDIAVYTAHPPDGFDQAAAEQALSRLGLLKFERRLRQLAAAWFGQQAQDWDDADRRLTDYILGAGAYGTMKITQAIRLSRAENLAVEKAKGNLRFVFPSCRTMQRQYPALLKAPVLLPLFWFARFFRIFTNRRVRAVGARKVYSSVNREYINYVSEMMQELHLDRKFT